MELHSAPEDTTCDVEDRNPYSATKSACFDEFERDRICFFRRVYLIVTLGSCLSALGVLVAIIFLSSPTDGAFLFLFVASIVAYAILVIFHQRWPHNVISFLLFKSLSFVFLLLFFRDWLYQLSLRERLFYKLATFIALQTISTTAIVFAFITSYLVLSKCRLSLAWPAVSGAVLPSAAFALLFFVIMPNLDIFQTWSVIVKGIGFRITSYCVSLILVAGIVTFVILDISKSYRRFGREEWILGVMAVYVDIVFCIWHVLSCRWYGGRKEEFS